MVQIYTVGKGKSRDLSSNIVVAEFLFLEIGRLGWSYLSYFELVCQDWGVWGYSWGGSWLVEEVFLAFDYQYFVLFVRCILEVDGERDSGGRGGGDGFYFVFYIE